jgi:hypothetical protein
MNPGHIDFHVSKPHKCLMLNFETFRDLLDLYDNGEP